MRIQAVVTARQRSMMVLSFGQGSKVPEVLEAQKADRRALSAFAS